MKLSEKQLDLIRPCFVDKPVPKAYLFGSYARGEADAESDIDLRVKLDYVKHIGMTFIGMKLDLEDLLAHQVGLGGDRSISRRVEVTIPRTRMAKNSGLPYFLRSPIL